MQSRDHALQSAIVGVVAAAATGASPLQGIPIVAYAVGVGVLIDLDHFPIARYNAGEWRALRYCLRHPSAVLLDQSAIFEPGEIGKHQRLLSHALVGGALVGVLGAAEPPVAILTATVLYVHVVADLIWDLRDGDELEEVPA